MNKDIVSVDKFLIRKKGFSFSGAGFYVYNKDEEKLLFVDIPDFKLVKQVDFYVDETKQAKLFKIKQDKVFFTTTAEYTLLLEGDVPLAKYRAELKDNLIKRNVKIMNPNGDVMCNLVEKSAFGGLLGELSGSDFLFMDGDEKIGSFAAGKEKRSDYSLDLTVEVERKLDARIALGAVIILYGRII